MGRAEMPDSGVGLHAEGQRCPQPLHGCEPKTLPPRLHVEPSGNITSSWDPHRKDSELKPKSCQPPLLDRILRGPGPLAPEGLTFHGEHPPAKVLKVDSSQVIGIQIFHKFFHLWEERCDKYKRPRNAPRGFTELG